MSATFNKLLAAVFLLPGCASQAQNQDIPYDLARPLVYELPKEINQISGISYQAADNSVFAIDDDHGDLFKIKLNKPVEVEKWEFGKANDYEDLVIVNETVYVLASKGEIVYFPLRTPVKDTRKAALEIEGKREFESLHKDPNSNNLVLLCKQCKFENDKQTPAFVFDLKNDHFSKDPKGSLKQQDVENRFGKKTGRIKPSATNINPLNNEVYILSSINKLLIVTDSQFSVKTVTQLDPKLFPQPEGLCFTPGGDLLISNEATKKKSANILYFSHKAAKSKSP